jgi:uncharacterized protein (PEP-CTERM system associated)
MLRRSRLSLAAGAVLTLAHASYAQELANAGPKPAVTVVPRVTVTETFTDNAKLNNAAKQSEQITEVAPGVRVTMDGGRVKGFVDYALSGLAYAQSSSPSRTQNALSSLVNVEAVDKTFFVDFSGSISQQTVSAFGTQSTNTSAVNANSTEVSTYRISPYFQGRIGTAANYEARYSRTVTASGGATPSGVGSNDALLRLSGGSGFKNLGWTADASQQNVAYSLGRATENDRFILGLTYAVTPQISVSANGGREANNFATVDKESNSVTGVGLNWTPLESTRLSAAQTHHSYGDTYQVSFDHRTSRTAWRFSDSKDVIQSPSQQGTASLGTVYDLFYNQFAAIEPNPVLRAQLVTAYLQAYGIPPGATVTTGFVSSALSMQRRQDMSFALLGVRDTITFIATQSEGNRFDLLTTAADDFSTSTVIKQQGLSVNWAHRLTPDYAFGVLVSQQDTSGNLSTQSTTVRSLNVNLTGKVGKKATATLGLRRVDSDNSLAPYTENAVTGAINMQF